MEKNCLVTKLKGTVTAEGMERLGYVKIRVANLESGSIINLNQASPNAVYLLEGDLATAYGSTQITVGAWDNLPQINASKGWIYIPVETELRCIKINDSNDTNYLFLHSSSLAKYPFLTNQLAFSFEEGSDIKDLISLNGVENETTLGYVVPALLQNTNIGGNFSDAAKLTDVTEFRFAFNNNAITGTVEDFVNVARTVRQDTQIQFNANTEIYFGGNLISGFNYNYLVWTSNSIILYRNTTWTENKEDYTNIVCKGVDAATIAAWEQAGKTVVVVS